MPVRHQLSRTAERRTQESTTLHEVLWKTQSPLNQRSRGLMRRLAASYSPTGLSSSTIRAAGLNGRVRDGNGCGSRAMTTNQEGGELPMLAQGVVGLRAPSLRSTYRYSSVSVLARLALHST